MRFFDRPDLAGLSFNYKEQLLVIRLRKEKCTNSHVSNKE